MARAVVARLMPKKHPMRSILPFLPLFLTAGILLAGNGLQGTLIALRAQHEGFGTVFVGLTGFAYYTGFISSSFTATRLIKAVGHIRVFAALAAIAAAGSLMLVLAPQPLVWLGVRAAMGFCFSGLFTVVESWLNEGADNATRGRVLSTYHMVDIAAVTGSQFLLPMFGADGFQLFAIMAMLFALSLVPVSLSSRSHPQPPEDPQFRLGTLWKISPLACIGIFSIGLTMSAFRLIGPLYARKVGLDIAGIALFMSAGIFGGGVMQMPIGILSDRFGRRPVLIATTTGAALAGLFLSFVAGNDISLIYMGSFMFGAFALPLYSLSTAHANDLARPGQFVLVSAGMLFFYALGATIGPLIASMVIEQWGAPAFFTYTSIVHGSLIITALFRISRRPSLKIMHPSRFASLIRTSPLMTRLAYRGAAQRRSRKKRKPDA
jgi:MFS family permease